MVTLTLFCMHSNVHAKKTSAGYIQKYWSDSLTVKVFHHCKRSLYQLANSGIDNEASSVHDDVMKWKHFPCYWPFVRGIHRSPVNSPHKGQWHGALMFSLICVWIYGWVNNHRAGDLRRHHAHYDVIIMFGWVWVGMQLGRLVWEDLFILLFKLDRDWKKEWTW